MRKRTLQGSVGGVKKIRRSKPDGRSWNLVEQIAHKIGGGTSQLNPLFVEEMMGFPPLWTTLPFLTADGVRKLSKPTATLGFHKWLRRFLEP